MILVNAQSDQHDQYKFHQECNTTLVRFKHELPYSALVPFDPVQIAPELAVADTGVKFDSLGVVYDEQRVKLQLMLSNTRYESAAYEATRAGYAIASYKMGEVTPYLGYSWVKSKAVKFSTPLAPPFDTLIPQIPASSHSDQHTWSLGARWDVSHNLDFKAQVDLIRGSPSSLFLFPGVDESWNGHMTVFSLTLDFVF
jgi:hypothetical protein